MLSVPGVNKINKSRYSLTTAHSCFCQQSLFFVGFFPVSFDIGDVSNKFVSARVIHVLFI